MKVNVYDLDGKPIEKIELPKVFNEQFRPDLIIRAVTSLQSERRQSYGTDPLAGLRTAASYHGRRRTRYSMMMRDLARLPRLHGASPMMSWRVRKVPSAVKGRKAHPPKVEKIWYQKMNKKEMKLALNSAIAATSKKDIVKKRGHQVDDLEDLPLIVKDKIQSIKKTKDLENTLKTLGLEKELERLETKKIRPGRGKMRGRKYKKKIGPLIIVNKDNGIGMAGKNLTGVDVKNVKEITVEDLAPGSHPGRLTIWSESSLKELS
jgi:large subunit ribosomal protein L4e